MIIHKLLFRYFTRGDDPIFYLMQAQESVKWIKKSGVELDSDTEVLDLGCGHGVFGAEFKKMGCRVTFADQGNYLLPELKDSPFIQINLDRDNYINVGKYDLVICSNVFEHLAKPDRFLAEFPKLLKPTGKAYLSWTNWLSPFGGHDYSPYHYLGPIFGRRLKFKLTGKWSDHIPYAGLYPTFIGSTLKTLRRNPAIRIRRMATRYYSEFSFLLRIPIAREFLAWNCALLITGK